MHIVAAHSSKRDLEWRTIALSCLPFAMHYHSSRDRTRQLPRMCSRTPLRHISDRATCRDRAHMCTHSSIRFRMTYDTVEIEDMEWSEELQAFTYQCPCGDLFQISMAELADGEELAHCPSCTLTIQVIYDPADFQPSLNAPEPPASAEVAPVGA